MPVATLFSVIESPAHPNFTTLYKRLDVNEVKFNSMRKVIAQLKKQRPDFIVAEFSYGYSNNYAGVNISNLAELFPLYAVLQFPVREQEIEVLLTAI